jgi:hypothetical protein
MPNFYVYGPSDMSVEQINNTTEKVRYLHHDQAGSTRLITGSAGTVEGKCSTVPTEPRPAKAPLPHRSAMTANT